MQRNIDEQIKFDRARKRVKAIKGFYTHFSIYLLVNVVIWILKAVNLGEGESFFSLGTFSTAIFWGIGILFHAFGVFGKNLILTPDWEDRKIKELMERQDNKNDKWE